LYTEYIELTAQAAIDKSQLHGGLINQYLSKKRKDKAYEVPIEAYSLCVVVATSVKVVTASERLVFIVNIYPSKVQDLLIKMTNVRIPSRTTSVIIGIKFHPSCMAQRYLIKVRLRIVT
jgi:hypothetical protein